MFSAFRMCSHRFLPVSTKVSITDRFIFLLLFFQDQRTVSLLWEFPIVSEKAWKWATKTNPKFGRLNEPYFHIVWQNDFRIGGDRHCLTQTTVRGKKLEINSIFLNFFLRHFWASNSIYCFSGNYRPSQISSISCLNHISNHICLWSCCENIFEFL